MTSILILGNGGRENVIKEKFKNYNVLNIDNIPFEEIKNICIERQINLVLPSKETFLCEGIVNYLQNELKGITKTQVFGPTKEQALIEGSKKYSKNLMIKLNIPTPNFTFYNSKSQYINHDIFFNKVIKYSGLAKGKGVYLPENNNEALSAIDFLFKNGKEGIIIENRLKGREVSVLAFCNGKEAFLMPQAQDYKRIYDNDKGNNTGGMGAIAPANILSESELISVKTHMDKVVSHLNYKGILYAGIMKTTEGIFFLEFNCRFGDPEAQVILNLLESDLLNIISVLLEGGIPDIKWKNKYSAAVVLSHELYPHKNLENPIPITFTSPLNPNVNIYESNITTKNNISFTTGGRVLSMVSTQASLQMALHYIYNNIHKISYEGAYYRRDIGSNNTNNCNEDKKENLSICVMGSGNGTCIQKLIESNKKDCIKIIITDKKDALIIDRARVYNIPFFYIPITGKKKRKYYELIVNLLRQFDIDIVILAGFMNIVTDELYEEFYTVNIHPSLLPKYKKMKDLNLHEQVIENNENFSGCTLHKVTKNIDEGDIIIQKQCRICPQETPLSLRKKVQTLENECILEFINNYNTEKVSYDVNINEGNSFVELIKQTNPEIGGFCAEYKYNGIKLAAAADGCGTKIDLSNRYNKLDTIGIDLVAMNINDLIAGGAKPLFFMDYIAIDKMDKDKCNKIIKGINKGCELAGCKLIGGETAEMKNIYLKNKLDIAGFAVGNIIHEFPQYNSEQDTYKLFGIASSGIHSNGYTLVNKLIKDRSDYNIDEILESTIIYTEVLDLFKKYPNNIFGVSHITGGGFEDNLRRIIPSDYDFELYTWDFPSIFKWIQRESRLSREEMLGIFNCGYGMVIISDIDLEFDEIGKLVKNQFSDN